MKMNIELFDFILLLKPAFVNNMMYMQHQRCGLMNEITNIELLVVLESAANTYEQLIRTSYSASSKSTGRSIS